MYPPTKGDSSFFMEEWATHWLKEGDGWDSCIYDVANFCPIKYREIVDSCTLTEIVRAWKTKMALSDFAWSDLDAIQKKTRTSM